MDLTIDRLTKQFGSKIAVDRVSTRLTPGVYGLLGANGAGKTTLMRMVCDVLRPTSGEIRFDGRDVRLLGDEYRARLGYLPQDFGYYPDFSALDFMCYLAALKGLDRRAARRRSLELLETVGLADVARAMSVSESALTKRFRREFGMTLGRYIDEMLAQEAARALSETDESIGRIAERNTRVKPGMTPMTQASPRLNIPLPSEATMQMAIRLNGSA